MRKFLVIILMLTPLCLYSQSSNLGNWFIYIGDKKINPEWNWHHEVQYRNYNFIGDLEQLVIRTGFGYNLTENNNNLHLGYAYIFSQNYIEGTDDKEDVHENRIYQQFITRQRFDDVSIQHRYRFEQRFIESDFRLRLRYFLALNIALTKELLAPDSFYISVYNEIFLNTEDNVFDRNRLYGGLGYRLNNGVRFEAGYLVQYRPEANDKRINLFAYVNF